MRAEQPHLGCTLALLTGLELLLEGQGAPYSGLPSNTQAVRSGLQDTPQPCLLRESPKLSLFMQ